MDISSTVPTTASHRLTAVTVSNGGGCLHNLVAIAETRHSDKIFIVLPFFSFSIAFKILMIQRWSPFKHLFVMNSHSNIPLMMADSNWRSEFTGLRSMSFERESHPFDKSFGSRMFGHQYIEFCETIRFFSLMKASHLAPARSIPNG
jgi:hypothetical protein